MRQPPPFQPPPHHKAPPRRLQAGHLLALLYSPRNGQIAAALLSSLAYLTVLGGLALAGLEITLFGSTIIRPTLILDYGLIALPALFFASIPYAREPFARFLLSLWFACLAISILLFLNFVISPLQYGASYQ